MILAPPRPGITREAFIFAPRTASRAVRDALVVAGWEPAGDHHDHTHPSLAGCRVYTIVRNLYDVFASWWYLDSSWPRDKQREWLEHIHELRESGRGGVLHQYAPGSVFRRWTKAADYWLRFEDITTGPAVLVSGYRFQIQPYNEKNNQRNGKPYQDVITWEGREFIEARYGEEMAELGYTWEALH